MPDTPQATAGRPATTRVAPFQFRGRYFTAVTLRPGNGPVDAAFLEALDEHLRQTPQFFEKAPMLIDLEDAGARLGDADLSRLLRELRARRMMPFGVLHAHGRLAELAAEEGLLSIDAGQDGPLGKPGPRRGGKRAPLAPANRLVTTPVRSGQVVVADGGDLTVVGPVSSGAELIAAGHIHVYGRMRGRAMAGVHGDESARIFCRRLDAELVAIAGRYRTPDNFDDAVRGQQVMVALEDDSLQMHLLD
ncbi:Septum site-determining protein MinC [Roseivivax jejudonensis]|uniref:Probable septum site-determining protein MinC n=1 Tax=Roseivivax jejudonensis TaxID=1529041 RepID=A0A1X6YUT8_9RHOB|nr:septum site-determining protein MinC [Roseivivax jejudonensis]SLN31286.1 Septum site-determining protein MinC [Roseivivax jejudonensis]